MSEESKRKSFSEELAEIVTQEGAIKEETASESQPEKAEEAPAPSQEEQKVDEPKVEKPEEPKPEDSAPKKEVPFHKHPRWIRQQKEVEELRAKLAERDERPAPTQSTPEKTVVPPQFAHLFGEDVEAYKAWQGLLDQTAETKAKTIYEQMRAAEKAQAEKETQARNQAVQFAEDQFLELADETGVDFTDSNNTARNQILDICQKYQLFTETGMPNIRAANELRQALYPEKNNMVEEKKKVASRATSSSTAPAAKSDVMTHQKLKEIERLGGMAYLLNQ